MNQDVRERRLPDGIWPVMLTPFTATGVIDWAALDELVDWYIQAGVAGLFATCLSSEIYALQWEERLEVAGHVVKRARGRVPVVAAGTFGGSVSEQAQRIKQMADTGVAATVVIVNQLVAAAEAETAWQARMEELLAATGALRLGLYECPAPYHRTLSPKMLGWAARTGRFDFMKDTCCRMDEITPKIAAVEGTKLMWLNANAPTLLASLRAGGRGYSGTAGNFVPELYVWLCANWARGDDRVERLNHFLCVADGAVRYKYPTSSKWYLAKLGLKIQPRCRGGDQSICEEEGLMFDGLREMAAGWRKELGLQ